MRLNITVEGKSYEVEVEVAEEAPLSSYAPTVRGAGNVAAPAPRRGAPKAAAPAPSSVSDDKSVKSPLAGNVSEIKVSAGQQVAMDEAVIVLEAMKMLTTITAPVAGSIKQIHVGVGDAVRQGQMLIEFE